MQIAVKFYDVFEEPWDKSEENILRNAKTS
jgi:hypothetical protein